MRNRMKNLGVWQAAFLVAVFAAMCAAARAHEPHQRPAAWKGTVEVPNQEPREAAFQYWLYTPAAYDKDDATREPDGWPLLLFLHGAGERGDNLDLVKIHGPPKFLDERDDFPFVTISPQCPTGGPFRPDLWNPHELMALIDAVCAEHRIDKKRIYVTGLSMGGYGSWRLAAHYPERIAAAIPICGGGETKWAEQLKQVPLWAFHGDADNVVPLKASEEMAEAVRAAGGDVELTVYKGVGHNSWTETYDNPKIYEWLLEHKK